MFEMAWELPVTFGPHWADEWQVWLTGGSIIASSILGFLAFRNGRSAVKIAADASTRDAEYRESERSAFLYAERTEVAHSIITAVISLDLLLHMQSVGAPAKQMRNLTSRANETKLKATVQIDLGVRDQDPEDFKDWFLRVYSRLQEEATEHGMDAGFRRIRGNAIKYVKAWRDKEVHVSDLPGVELL